MFASQEVNTIVALFAGWGRYSSCARTELTQAEREPLTNIDRSLYSVLCELHTCIESGDFHMLEDAGGLGARASDPAIRVRYVQDGLRLPHTSYGWTMVVG